MTELFGANLGIVNVGVSSFLDPLAGWAEIVQLDWRPPGEGDAELAWLVAELADDPSEAVGAAIKAANTRAVETILAARPHLIGVQPASDAIPNLGARTILHAGPPIAWEHMCGPMRGAVIGAILFEGWADDAQGAQRLVERGEIALAPCHHYGAVGPMAGILSPSMPVLVVENQAFGNRAYATLNEGLGRVLRFGAWDDEVLTRLRWMRDGLGPPLHETVEQMGPIDLRSLVAQALQMGDECHNRNVAATSLFTRRIAPTLGRAGGPAAEVLDFLAANDHFFLNLSMAAAKATLDAIPRDPACTVVTAMARNGVEFGIRVAGTGDRWFTAPAGLPEGLYFPGYGPAEANPDLGDSAITETSGIGGFAMATAPAIVRFVGGTPSDALAYTEEMQQITLARNPDFALPALGFAGTPTAIDVRRVVETGIAPVINTGIAHREPGIGQIGAGVVRAPLACFHQALRALAAGLLTEPVG